MICSRIGGLPEIVEEEKTGLLYKPGNVDELAHRIRMLWQDPAVCQRLGDAGGRKVREEYAADRLLGIYEKVITESAGRGRRAEDGGRNLENRRLRTEGWGRESEDRISTNVLIIYAAVII